MKSDENMPRTAERAPAFAVQHVSTEDLRRGIRGDVLITMRDGGTGKTQLERELHNLVVLDASILIARLMKDNHEPAHGILALAVGTGDSNWNLQSPPAPTTTQRALYSELARKTFSTTQFVDGLGVPTTIPTHVVDFTTTFAESEAVGPLVEMALLGGNISSNMAAPNRVPSGPYDPTVDLTQYDTMINSLRFAVINKPATSTLTITWRLTF
jgi:hypothetical protein